MNQHVLHLAPKFDKTVYCYLIITWKVESCIKLKRTEIET